MKLLLIGGTGTIGSFVTRELVRPDVRVTVLARGVSRNDLLRGLWVEFVRGDRGDTTLLRKLSEGSYDCVVDLACYGPDHAENAISAFGGRVKQYLFVSTVDVYTKPARVYPITEEMERNPRSTSPYAWKKARCEEIFLVAHVRGEFTVTIVRPAHTYGEGVTPLLQVLGGTDHLDRLPKGKPIILHGDGNSLWSSCYAKDVAEAIANAVLNTNAYGQAYTLASKEVMTWKELYKVVAEEMHAPSPFLVHVPVGVLTRAFPKENLWCRENFQYSNLFCVAKAERDLGFRSSIDYRLGVKRCLSWFRNHGGFGDSGRVRFHFYDRFLAMWEQMVTSLPIFEEEEDSHVSVGS